MQSQEIQKRLEKLEEILYALEPKRNNKRARNEDYNDSDERKEDALIQKKRPRYLTVIEHLNFTN